MIEGIRELRQKEAMEAYLKSDGRSIIYACPRMGKIKVAIDISTKLTVGRALIFAPRIDIFQGWKDDFHKFCVGYPIYVDYITFAGIKNLETELWNVNLVIIDEPHEMSVNQQRELAEKLKDYKGRILGLTGTMTQKTRDQLYKNLNLDVCYKYTINQGVEEGILADYKIFIHEVPLDTKILKYQTRQGRYSEKKYFDIFSHIKEEQDSAGKFFFDLKLISVLQKSIAKQNKTIELIKQYKDERLLVFCGLVDIADSLGIPVYHSKAREKKIFDDFCSGGIPHLATIKMMQAGITVNPINKGIVNYTSGSSEDGAQKICRFLGFEYDNPEKKAEIHLVCSSEDFERNRLKTALLFFNKEKIELCV